VSGTAEEKTKKTLKMMLYALSICGGVFIFLSIISCYQFGSKITGSLIDITATQK
jgi:hypothetical protein